MGKQSQIMIFQVVSRRPAFGLYLRLPSTRVGHSATIDQSGSHRVSYIN